MKLWCARCRAYTPQRLNRERLRFSGEYQCGLCANIKPTPKGYAPLDFDPSLTPSELKLLTEILTDRLMGLDDVRAEAESRGEKAHAASLGRAWDKVDSIIAKLAETHRG